MPDLDDVITSLSCDFGKKGPAVTKFGQQEFLILLPCDHVTSIVLNIDLKKSYPNLNSKSFRGPEFIGTNDTGHIKSLSCHHHQAL